EGVDDGLDVEGHLLRGLVELDRGAEDEVPVRDRPRCLEAVVLDALGRRDRAQDARLAEAADPLLGPRGVVEDARRLGDRGVDDRLALDGDDGAPRDLAPPDLDAVLARDLLPGLVRERGRAAQGEERDDHEEISHQSDHPRETISAGDPRIPFVTEDLQASLQKVLSAANADASRAP